jgi:addiction module HigA family antidote
MNIHKHPHPGEIIKDLLERNNLTVTETANRLKITRPSISRLINCRSNISPEMAIRLTAFFGGSIGQWLRLQAGYDEWIAENQLKKKIIKQISKIKKLKQPKRNIKAA